MDVNPSSQNIIKVKTHRFLDRVGAHESIPKWTFKRDRPL